VDAHAFDVRALPRTQLGWLRQAWRVFQKDLLIERRTREITSTSAFFAALVAITASVAMQGGADTRTRVAPGVIWIAVAFAAVLAVGKSWQREREESALDGLLVSPLARSAIFAGKALGIAVFLLVVELVVIPLVSVLFSVELGDVAPGVAVVVACATPGIAVTGTLFGAMTVRTQARDLVLASVLLPLLLPMLLAAVAATREVLGGAPMGDIRDYVVIMLAFDVVFTAGGLWLFGLLVDA
jgi:heme exporter protein B